MRTIVLLSAVLALPLPAGERQQIQDLAGRVVDLKFRVTDLEGNPVAIAGRVESMRVVETPTTITIDLAADVLFEFDRAALLPAAEETLARAATILERESGGAVRVEGHTDSHGDEGYNLALSRRRAESVRDWFVRSGLPAGRFSVHGAGERVPAVSNTFPDGRDDPEGRRRNRRVVVTVSRSGG